MKQQTIEQIVSFIEEDVIENLEEIYKTISIPENDITDKEYKILLQKIKWIEKCLKKGISFVSEYEKHKEYEYNEFDIALMKEFINKNL